MTWLNFPGGIGLTVSLLLIVIGLWFASRQIWRYRLLHESLGQHLLFGCTLFLTLIWSLDLRWEEQLSVHFLCVSVTWLVLGESLAFIALTLAQGVILALGRQTAGAMIANVVILSTALVPPALLRGWLRRQMWNNPIAFILVSGFLGGILGMWLVSGVVLGMGYLSDLIDADAAITLMQYAILLAFGEGFINGTITSALVVFFPRLLFSMRGLEEL